MEDRLGKFKKTAEEVGGRLGEAVKTAGEQLDLAVRAGKERVSDFQETQRLSREIRRLQRERDRLRLIMADLLIRMFDQSTFAEALLRPEYEQIKKIAAQVATLEEERAAVGKRPAEAPAAEAPAEE